MNQQTAEKRLQVGAALSIFRTCHARRCVQKLKIGLLESIICPQMTGTIDGAWMIAESAEISARSAVFSAIPQTPLPKTGFLAEARTLLERILWL
jgi:hypothetical protein